MTSVSVASLHLSSVFTFRSLLSFILLLLITPSPIFTSPLQSAILKKLGLTTPPTLTGPHLPIPDHIWDDYGEAQEGEMEEDSLRLFYPKDILETNSGFLLSYNLSLDVQLALREHVVSAEMRVRTKGEEGRVKAYRVRGEQFKVDRLLDSAEAIGDGIVRLDVTDALDNQEQQRITWILLSLPEDRVLSPTPLNSISSIPLAQHSTASLVVRYNNKDEGSTAKPTRRKRTVKEERRSRKERKGRRKGRKHPNRVHGERGLCQRRSMYVDFEELNWQDWILAPKGYNAYECSGGCQHPIPAHLNASNHAIVQALIHSLNPTIPSPCCIPTEMQPLTILYMDVGGRIVMKNYPDMVVSACGCR